MAVPPPPDGWLDYWTRVGDKRIFAEEARDHVSRLQAVRPLRRTDAVLDFGCGFGHTVELLAPLVGEVAFWDGAPGVLRSAAARSAHLSNVKVVDLGDGDPLGRYDVVLVTSVVQYMRRDELASWLARWRTMLRGGGRIVVSDVPRPDHSAWGEVGEMLRFARRHGFLRQAVREGLAEAGRYTRMRRRIDLLRLTPPTLAALAAGVGMSAEQLPANLTHRTGRYAVVLRNLHDEWGGNG